MGNLPTERVSMARPFTTAGVDFCGPIMTTYKQRGMRTTKSYIAVFVCFVGGLWEAAVKSAKYHLVRILGEAFLTFEELCTVVAEVEATLNSRPLTAMSSDPSDEAVITPGHFLTGGPLVGILEPIIESEHISNLNRWVRLTAIKQHFWKRWSSEYLYELQRKTKWTANKENVVEGDLVLVSEDNAPPKSWLIGRVTRAIKAADGYVRVVDIETKNGCIRRAIQKVASIPKPE
ncbi:PREDICTED: uncharacterized protein LOC108355616 [Rhagoletis zephyria]|uniref:uncharacterized protein LOC108355616 n=1 Tax=Rhagoletis zephyria TaxID=28612 RepID=UPI0008113327|nr:PREDICTED: uncharacterized protein LOC108355616 [Rhagoletis zephyria]